MPNHALKNPGRNREVGLGIRLERLREYYSAQSLPWYKGPFNQAPFLCLWTRRSCSVTNLKVAPMRLDRQGRSVTWMVKYYYADPTLPGRRRTSLEAKVSSLRARPAISPISTVEKGS